MTSFELFLEEVEDGDEFNGEQIVPADQEVNEDIAGEIADQLDPPTEDEVSTADVDKEESEDALANEFDGSDKDDFEDNFPEGRKGEEDKGDKDVQDAVMKVEPETEKATVDEGNGQQREEELDVYSEDWGKFGITFQNSEDNLFNICEVYKRHRRDYSFFLKFQKYNHVTHYVHNKEPFTHLYEKNYWQYTFFDKFCRLLRNKLSPLSSSPFLPSGECSFFEFETLYSPQRCVAYSLRTRELSSINLKRFSRSLMIYTSDVYGDILIEGIDTYDDGMELSKFVASPGQPKLVDDACGKDDIPTTKIDRNAWPAFYIDRESLNMKNIKFQVSY